jgi:hypothetical protein
VIRVPLPTTVLIVPAAIPAAKIATICQSFKAWDVSERGRREEGHSPIRGVR